MKRLRTIWICTGAAAAVLMLLAHRLSTASVFQAAVAFMLACAAAHDLETRRIENRTVITVATLRLYEIALGAIAGTCSFSETLSYSLLGAAAVLAVLLATTALMERRSGSAGIGGGDVKLLTALGFCYGWETGLAIAGLSCALLLLHNLAPHGLRPARGAAFAFAPYIAVASLFTVLAL